MDKNLIKSLATHFRIYEELRKQLLANQDSYITSLQNNGFTALEALNKWQNELQTITDQQDNTVKEIKALIFN
jgi:peptidoglycan hydrolase CwlO-like protein